MSTGTRDEQSKRTRRSFGYEWTRFSDNRPEDESYWKWYFEDVPLAALQGRIGLDAGCGRGRYTRFTAKYLSHLVALDDSDAVVAAANNLNDLSNTIVVRADLRTAPFAYGSFGFICCLGVLHHLPDPRAGFLVLKDLLSANGLILIYVYSRPAGLSVRHIGLTLAGWLRRVTTHLPYWVLRATTVPIAGALYAMIVIPGSLGDRLGIHAASALPLKIYRRGTWKSLWLDTFDRLSAPIERRYSLEELTPWFEEAGLDLVFAREDEAGLFLLGRRP
jgi:SAM-dependent methyltransferase